MARGKPNAALYRPFMSMKVCLKFRYNIGEKLKVCASLKFCISQNFFFSTVIKTSTRVVFGSFSIPACDIQVTLFHKISVKNFRVPNTFRASW